jgi:steroid 5-alpha reductase family enzyme
VRFCVLFCFLFVVVFGLRCTSSVDAVWGCLCLAFGLFLCCCGCGVVEADVTSWVFLQRIAFVLQMCREFSLQRRLP